MPRYVFEPDDIQRIVQMHLDTPLEFGGTTSPETELVPLSHAVAHPSLYPTELLR